jgi:hypothetical protein
LSKRGDRLSNLTGVTHYLFRAAYLVFQPERFPLSYWLAHPLLSASRVSLPPMKRISIASVERGQSKLLEQFQPCQFISGCEINASFQFGSNLVLIE